MGGVFSKKVGDRTNMEYGANPYDTQGAQPTAMASSYEDDRYGKEQLPTGTVLPETTNGQQTVVVTTSTGTWGGTGTTTTSPTFQATSWGQSNTDETVTATGTGTNGWGNGQSGGQEGNAAAGSFMLLLFIGLVVGVPLLTTTDFGSGSSFGGSPTPSPTSEPIAVGNVDLCPATFVGGTNLTIAGCDSDGCSGSVRWCGLNDAISYRVQAGVRGDLDASFETITISVTGGGAPTDAGTISQCGSSFEPVFDETVSSSSGEITLSYSNTVDVNDFCSGFAVRLSITLTEIP